MAEITIDDDIAQQVITLAEQGQSTISAVLRAMLEIYADQQSATASFSSNWAAEMGRMADEDTTGVWDAFSPDLSERSRDILDSEFANYLLERSDSNPDHD